MVDDSLLKSVQKAFFVVKELNEMSIEDLQNICEQYGDKCDNLTKEELILLVLKRKLTPEEFKDYQKYLNYYNFRHSMSNLFALDSSIDSIQRAFEKKYKLSLEMNRVVNAKREVEIALINELPLVRLNIEYSHVKRDLDNYISKRTASGMKIASISDEIEYIKAKNILYRFINRGKIEGLKKQVHDTRVAALVENDAMFKQYEATVKGYGGKLKELFFKMLDNRLVGNAVYLYRNLPMDVSKDDFYKVKSTKSVKFSIEEKEAIFEDFLKDADFDPERDITGPIFYEAVKKYVTKYYSIMESRISSRKNALVNEVEKIVSQQKTFVNGIYKDFALQYGADGETLASLYEDDDIHIRRKK